MSTAPLPKEITDRINKDSDAWVNPRSACAGAMQSSYIEGATAEATRALLLIEALEKIANNTATPYNEEQAYSWIETARYLAKEALTEYNQQP